MAKYKYLITDKYGKEKKGTMEAVSEEAAMRKLKGEGSIVLELSEAFDLDNASWNITIGNPVKKKDITIFCKQFYSILTAGVTVIDGLRMVQDQTENKYLREALYRVMVNVEKGDSLADAMEMESKIFPSLLIHMVAAGEATGNLEIAFNRICTQFDKDMKLNSMIKSAMIYPIVVLVVAVGVIIVLMTTVIPNFQQTFESMGADADQNGNWTERFYDEQFYCDSDRTYFAAYFYYLWQKDGAWQTVYQPGRFKNTDVSQFFRKKCGGKIFYDDVYAYYVGCSFGGSP